MAACASMKAPAVAQQRGSLFRIAPNSAFCRHNLCPKEVNHNMESTNTGSRDFGATLKARAPPWCGCDALELQQLDGVVLHIGCVWPVSPGML